MAEPIPHPSQYVFTPSATLTDADIEGLDELQVYNPLVDGEPDKIYLDEGTNTLYAFHSGKYHILNEAVQDTLLSDSAVNPLSANQGRVLDGRVTANQEAIANLSVSNAEITNETTPAIASISQTATVLPFAVNVNSTDENVMTLNDANDTITFLTDSDIDFTSHITFTSSTTDARSITFNIINTADDSVLKTTTELLAIQNNNSQQVTLSTLLTVGENGVQEAPLTVKVEVLADGTGYELTSFTSTVKAGTDRNITVDISNKVERIVSIDNVLTRFDGVDGDVQNTGILVDDGDNIADVQSLNIGKSEEVIRIVTNSSGGYMGTTTAVPLFMRTNSITRATITKDGKIGIGTTPNVKFEVNATESETARFGGGANPYITVGTGNGAGDGAYLQFTDNGQTILSPHARADFRISADGNIGVNKSTPEFKLDVEGGATDKGVRIRSGGNSGYDLLDVADVNSNSPFIVKANGNVGVGTSDPKMQLQVNTNGGIDGDANQLILRNNVYSSSGSKYLEDGFASLLTMRKHDGAIKILTIPEGVKDEAIGTGSVKFAINSDGKVGIGKDNPATPLDIAVIPTYGSSGSVRFSRMDSNTTRYADLKCGVGSSDKNNFITISPHSGTEGVTVDAITAIGNGNVGINTNDPSKKLDVNGNALLRGNGRFSTPLTIGTPTSDNYVKMDFITDVADATKTFLVAYGSANNEDGSLAIKNNVSHTTTNGTAGDIWFSNATGETVRIKGDSGNMGVGKTPTEKFDVNGEVKATVGGVEHKLSEKANGGTFADNQLLRGDGTSTIQGSGILINDGDDITGVTSLNIGHLPEEVRIVASGGAGYVGTTTAIPLTLRTDNTDRLSVDENWSTFSNVPFVDRASGLMAKFGNSDFSDKYIELRNSAQGVQIGLNDGLNAGLIKTGQNKGFAIKTNDDGEFKDVVTPDFLIDEAGKVGIGGTPKAQLDVKATTAETARFGGASNPYITIGTGSGSGEGAYLQFTDDGQLILSQHAHANLRIRANGNVEHANYTKLGGIDAPAIKHRKYTGTTSSSQGGTVSIPHGVASAKIHILSAKINYGTYDWVTVPYDLDGYRARVVVAGSDIKIIMDETKSSNILGKPFEILIAVEE